MQTAIEIGNKIAVARKIKNLSQTELAALMSVTSQAVGKWERGESMPDILTFDRLSAALGVELNYFSQSGSDTLPSGTEAKAAYDTEEPEETSKRPEWNMSGGNWEDSDFSGLSGIGDRFSGSNINRCKFIGSGLSLLTLHGNNVQDSDFSGSVLSDSRFLGCNLESSFFNNCDITGAEFKSSNIRKCEFNGADFTGTVFRLCNIDKSNIAGAIWNRVVFKQTQFSDMIFTDDITDCAFEGLKTTRVVFRGITLRNTFFKNCNLKKLVFENCYTDNLTLAFMKNSKANTEGVILLK